MENAWRKRELVESFRFPLFFGVSFLIVGVLIASGFATKRASLQLSVELDAVPAVVKSPAVILPIRTLTEFKTLQQNLNTAIYFSDNNFYLIPDNYKGYVWVPEWDVSWDLSTVTLKNR